MMKMIYTGRRGQSVPCFSLLGVVGIAGRGGEQILSTSPIPCEVILVSILLICFRETEYSSAKGSMTSSFVSSGSVVCKV